MIAAIGLIVFTVILAFLLILSRVHAGPKKTQKVSTNVTQDATRDFVSVNDIANNPMVYNGYNLEVDSQITSWATNRSFYFSGAAASTFGGGARKRLLVIAPKPFQLPQNPNDNKVGLGETAKVTAKGTIQVLNKEQLESTLGVDFSSPSASLYDSSLKNWYQGPVLILGELTVDPNAR